MQKLNPPEAKRAKTQGNDFWHQPSPLNEAAGLFTLFKNGMPEGEIRTLINVTPKERVELEGFAREYPALASRIRACLLFRQETLEIFNRMIKRFEKEKAA